MRLHNIGSPGWRWPKGRERQVPSCDHLSGIRSQRSRLSAGSAGQRRAGPLACGAAAGRVVRWLGIEFHRGRKGLPRFSAAPMPSWNAHAAASAATSPPDYGRSAGATRRGHRLGVSAPNGGVFNELRHGPPPSQHAPLRGFALPVSNANGCVLAVLARGRSPAGRCASRAAVPRRKWTRRRIGLVNLPATDVLMRQLFSQQSTGPGARCRWNWPIRQRIHRRPGKPAALVITSRPVIALTRRLTAHDACEHEPAVGGFFHLFLIRPVPQGVCGRHYLVPWCCCSFVCQGSLGRVSLGLALLYSHP